MQQLSEFAGAPLRALQIASGNNLVVGLDLPAVLKDLTAALEEDPAVASVEPASSLAPDQETGTIELSVKTVDATAQFDYSIPLGLRTSTSIAVDQDKSTVQVDVRKLFQFVIKRLQMAPGVRYVEPMRMLQPDQGN